ncbi:MarR family winged helix-turn-helix transcriptional regulator [Lacrimispora brassicae]
MEYSKEIHELFLMQQAYATLMSAANKLEKQADKYYKKLTSRQYMAILAILHLPPDETTVKNIAKKLGTTKQNANQLLTTVEKKGYITISGSDIDKRSVNIKVTDAGLQAMVENGEIGTIFMADIFNGFDEKELATLWHLLKKLHCFDGEKFSGFEDDASQRLEGDYSDLQAKALEEFKRRRNR